MFYNDVEYFVGHPVAAATSTALSLPKHWLPYLDADPTMRLSNLPTDLAPLATLMPKTYASLLARVKEVFLVQEGESIIRVLNKAIEDTDDLYSYMSKTPVADAGSAVAHPLFFTHSPDRFSQLYRTCFDGLFDASMSGGFLPLSRMTPLSNMAEDFRDYAWHPQLETLGRLDDIVMVFSSGGGGYLFLDLGIDQSQLLNPTCILIMHDADEPPETNVGLWEYLDAWTSIAMGE